MTTITTTLRGEYNIVVKHADGTETETGWFKNLILNSGLNLLGSSSDPIKFARVGTGNSTPVVTQTSLDAQIASTVSPITQATSRVNSGSPLYETLFTNTFVFAQGAVVGNITEVGIGWATSGATLFSRALILDNLGFPTTLTLVALDQLTVFYRLNLTPSVSDTTGSVTLNAIPYSYTCRAATIASFASNIGAFQTSGDGFSNAYTNINTYPAGSVLGPVTGIPTGVTLYQAPSLVNITYSAGTFYRDSTWTWGPSLANHTGGLQSIQFVWGLNGYYTYQLRFDTPVPKTNTTTLVLQMRFAWNRV